MDGILNLNKPTGITSHDVVNRVRRILKTRKVGHAGTLDPLATGVLLVCVGQATRLADFLVKGEKEYEAVLILGIATDTEDSSGEVISSADASHVQESDIVQVLTQFLGNIEQTPPMVSAVHHQGRRLYELAREGIVVERDPRQVEISSITLSDFRSGANPCARLRVICSKGVYIRTLIADIGSTLGVGAHMSELTRTRIGRFRLQDSVTLETLAGLAESGRQDDVIIPMADGVRELPNVTISSGDVENIRHGRQVLIDDQLDVSDDAVAVLTPDGRLAAISQLVSEEGQRLLQPKKVFV